jgi:hypothetical protein
MVLYHDLDSRFSLQSYQVCIESQLFVVGFI